MRIAMAVMAASLVLAGCGSKSDTELASGTITDPDTGEKTDYSVTTDGDEGNLSIKTEDGEMHACACEAPQTHRKVRKELGA